MEKGELKSLYDKAIAIAVVVIGQEDGYCFDYIEMDNKGSLNVHFEKTFRGDSSEFESVQLLENDLLFLSIEECVFKYKSERFKLSEERKVKAETERLKDIERYEENKRIFLKNL